jgi:hypothetical protein
MFPPQLPHIFIRWLTEPDDAVYDPFSGRGTVPLEAVLVGRKGYGSDANPLAAALTKAKVVIPPGVAVTSRLTELVQAYVAPSIDRVPDDIKMLYAAETLQQILYLRSELDPTSDVDSFVIGMLLGLLHGNHSKAGATRGLSISMPNTFAMSPGYVRRFISTNGLEAPVVDVFQMLRRRVEHLELPQVVVNRGRAWLQDAATPPPKWLSEERVKLVFTSPPYLRVIKYGKYNWVRLWFLGAEPKAVDAGLTDTGSLVRYREFIGLTLENLRGVLRDDGYVCLVIGDVRRRNGHLNLAQDVWDSVAKPAGWFLHGIIADRLPPDRKVSRIWKLNPGRATRTDRILVMSPSGPAAELPPLGRVRWTKDYRWPTEISDSGRGA